MAKDAVDTARNVLNRLNEGNAVTKDRLIEVLTDVVAYLDRPHDIVITMDKDTGLFKGTYS